jgi:hypothetical protein
MVSAATKKEYMPYALSEGKTNTLRAHRSLALKTSLLSWLLPYQLRVQGQFLAVFSTCSRAERIYASAAK